MYSMYQDPTLCSVTSAAKYKCLSFVDCANSTQDQCEVFHVFIGSSPSRLQVRGQSKVLYVNNRYSVVTDPRRVTEYEVVFRKDPTSLQKKIFPRPNNN